MDLYFSEGGDIKLSTYGDVAITEKEWRDVSQQAYIRIMTDPGDFTLYPSLGAEMSLLYGMPQNRETADYGIGLIRSSLDREGAFQGRNIVIKAIPTGPQSIRFDIYIIVGNRDELILQLEQNLGEI